MDSQRTANLRTVSLSMLSPHRLPWSMLSNNLRHSPCMFNNNLHHSPDMPNNNIRWHRHLQCLDNTC